MSENEAEAFLMTAGDSIEADMIESLLKANDIPVLRKYREGGGYMMIMMGNTIYGVDLYVPGDMFDKAREIVENSREASEDAAFPENVKPAEMSAEDMEELGGDTEEAVGDTEETGEDTDEAVGDTEDEGSVEGGASEPETGDIDEHEEQYRLAAELTDRRRRGRAWMTFLFFVILIFSITMFVKYLYVLIVPR